MIAQSESSVKFQLTIADNLRGFLLQNGQFSQQFMNFHVKSLILATKPLDNPIPWYKKVVAKMVRLSTQHHFLIFKFNQIQVVGSIDFYNSNKIVLRIGNNQTIMEENKSGKRSELKATENMVMFDESSNKFQFKDLMEAISMFCPSDGYKELSYNCFHFSQNIMKYASKNHEKRIEMMKGMKKSHINLVLNE